jgi:hypothetical protein
VAFAMGEKLDTTRLQIFVSVDRLLRRTQYRGCEERSYAWSKATFVSVPGIATITFHVDSGCTRLGREQIRGVNSVGGRERREEHQ